MALAGCGADALLPEEAAGPAVLAPIQEPDPALAATGLQAFEGGELFQGVLPPLALRNLYITWTEQLATLYNYYSDEDAFWEAFNARYGTVPSAFPAAVYPSGFGLADNGEIGFDCMLCHAGRLQGETVLGLANNRLDLRGLVEDLQRLPEAIQALKERDLPDPYGALIAAIPDTMVPEPYASMEIFTAVAGANDGFGLGFVTAAAYSKPPEGMHTFMGYQDAPMWSSRRRVSHARGRLLQQLHSRRAPRDDGDRWLPRARPAWNLGVGALPPQRFGPHLAGAVATRTATPTMAPVRRRHRSA